MNFILKIICVCLLPSFLIAQDEYGDTLQPVDYTKSHKGFHLGLYVGAYFPNKFTAGLYDGYGYDIDGQRNNFANSVLRNEIVNNYGGGNGGVDQVGTLLNVSRQDWYFAESGMPVNLKYTPTYLVGLNMRYRVDKYQAITLNINGTKLIVNGKFNVNTTQVSTAVNPGISNPQTLHQFTITGAEQRLMFQFGYQRYIGKNEKINFMVEAGMNIIMAKLQKNQAYLNTSTNGGFVIDLTNVYNQPNYNYYRSKYFIGVGIGAYAGLGINVNINPKYTIQLLYTPAYDRVPLGDNYAFKLQHGIGLRFYYNLSS